MNRARHRAPAALGHGSAYDHPGPSGRWRWLIAVSIVCAGSGCAHYQAAPLEPRHSAEEFAARQLTDPQLRELVTPLLPQASAQWPPQRWNRAQLLAVALVRNPDLAVAHAEAQAALMHEVTAAEYPNPDLTLQSEYARHDPYAWLYGVSASWLLRSGEQRRLEIDAARLDTLNAHLRLMEQTWAVRRALTAALSEWESTRRRLSLLERLAAAQDRLVSLERQRVKGGEDAPSELLVAERERLDIERLRAEQRVAANVAQAAAAQALGVLPQGLDSLAISWPDWGEPAKVSDAQLDAAREQALLSRADLRVAIGEYAVAEKKLQRAIVRQYPQFVLQPGFYWDHGIAKFPFWLTFEVPFNANRGEIADARAARELAGRHMLAVQADIYGEIAEAERAERIARASEELAQRQLQAAHTQEQQAELALRLGAMDSLARTGAEIISIRAELEVLAIREQLQASRNALEDVLHAPLTGPELALASSFVPATAGGP